MPQHKRPFWQSRIVISTFAGFLLGAAFAFGLTFFWQVRFDNRSSLERGYELARLACSRCHGIGQSDESTHPKAPLFRKLAARLTLEGLAEQLEIGLSLGHAPMPPWKISPQQSDDLLAYLVSLQAQNLSNKQDRK